MLFFQYQALENNARIEDSASLDLIQNDLYSNNFINQDTLIHSIIGNNENKYLRKRQVDKKGEQIKQKSSAKTKSKAKVPPKKPTLQKPKPPSLKPKPPSSKPKPPSLKLKPPASKPKPSSSKPKPPASKPPVPRSTTRKPSKVKTTTRKTTTKATAVKKTSPSQTIKPTAKSSSRTTTKKPVTSTEKTIPSKTTPKITTSTSTVTTTTRSTTEPTTTPDPEDFDKLKSKLISDINILRLKHQAKKLTVNTTLAELAQKLTDNPYKRDNDPDPNLVGLMQAITKAGVYEDPLLIWTRDSEYIDYTDFNEGHVPDNFAQLVWVATTDIGCGISKVDDDNGAVVLTLCLFYPKGNNPGEYQENVKPEIDQKIKKR